MVLGATARENRSVPTASIDPLHVEAVRDLLALVRALYAALRVDNGAPYQLARVERLGKDLALAVDLATRVPEPTSLGHRAARGKVERVLEQLRDLLRSGEIDVSAATLVEAASRPLRKTGAATVSKSEQRKLGLKGRG